MQAVQDNWTIGKNKLLALHMKNVNNCHKFRAANGREDHAFMIIYLEGWTYFIKYGLIFTLFQKRRYYSNLEKDQKECKKPGNNLFLVEEISSS